MNLIHKISHKAVYFTAMLLCAGSFVSCAEHELHNNGSNGGTDYNELFTHAFIKEFGVFKGKAWNEAVNGAIKVRTAKPTAINVFAEVGGQRYIFASLGSVNGLQPVVVTIPTEVNELIVTADDEEYKVKLGETLDLTKNASRYHMTPEFVTNIPDLNGFDIVRMPEVYREIGLGGAKLRDTWLRYKQGEKFNIFDAEHNFTNSEEFKIFNSSCFYGSESDDLSDFTVYPLYWRENVYGESDYMLGIYYYHQSIGDNNVTKEIRMIDLEDFDLKNAISFKKTGTDEFVVSQKGEAYDAHNLNNKDELHSKGYHMKMKNLKPEGKSVIARVGFYIKSGLKEGSTPEKGRNYTHISFQNCMFNGIEWGDNNYWNTTLKDITKCYSGAATYTGSVVYYGNDKPSRVDGLAPTYDALGTNDAIYYIIGFTSQPNGPAAGIPDYSDVVLAWTHRSGGSGRELPGAGETFGAFPWYLASEDLGSLDDWDFNDIVVTIYDLTTDMTRPYVSARGRYPVPTIMGRRITVVPRAAGSTMPIYLIYEGEVSEDATDDSWLSAINTEFTNGAYVVGTEIHEWLGEPDYTQMLNTGLKEGYNGCGVSFCIPIDESGLSQPNFTDFPQTIGFTNQAMRNFWVLVDKEDAMRAELSNPLFDRTPIEPEYNKDFSKVTRNISQSKNVLKPFSGRLGHGAYRVDPPSENYGTAPQMLMCHCVWHWPLERVNIGEAYTSFRDWVAGKRTTWHGNPGEGEGLNGYYPEMVHPYVATAWMQ